MSGFWCSEGHASSMHGTSVVVGGEEDGDRSLEKWVPVW